MSLLRRLLKMVMALFGGGKTALLAKIHRSASGSGWGGSGTLSAPRIGYPSSQTLQPSIVCYFGADAQVADVVKMAFSASSAIISPTIIAHTVTATDLTNGSFVFPIPALSTRTYFQALVSRAGVDSQNLSNVVAWGDTTAPVITNSEVPGVGTAFQAYETVAFFQPVTVTDIGGVPALVSTQDANGVWSPGAFIAGGADQSFVEVAVVGGVLGYRLTANTVLTAASPLDQNQDNYYDFTLGVVDYSGNVTTKALEFKVNAITVTITPALGTINNATPSSTQTSAFVTVSITPNTLTVAASLTAGATYQRNSAGGYLAAGSLTSAAHGDTFTLQAAAPGANNQTEAFTLTAGSATNVWTINTPVTTTGFNPSDKESSITLSNPNAVGFLTALNGGGVGPHNVRTIGSFSAGKHALRFHVDVAAGWYGFMDGSQPLTNFPTNSLCVAHDGSVFVGSGSASSLSAPIANDTIDVLLDLDASPKRGWIRKNSTWHATCGDPTAAGVGFDLSSMTTPLFGFFTGRDAGSQATLQAVTVTGFTSVI